MMIIVVMKIRNSTMGIAITARMGLVVGPVFIQMDVKEGQFHHTSLNYR